MKVYVCNGVKMTATAAGTMCETTTVVCEDAADALDVSARLQSLGWDVRTDAATTVAKGQALPDLQKPAHKAGA